MGVAHKIGQWLHTLVLMHKEEKLVPVVVPKDPEDMLVGKLALVTGGSSGIGLAIAKEFASCGADVVIAGTRQEKVDAVLETIGGHVKGIVIDVRDVSTLPDKVEQASSLFGRDCFDILVNSAGVVTHHDFWHTDESEYDAIMDTNAKGTFFMSQTVGRRMVEKGIKGHILNIASSSSLRPAWTPYQMSKWAVRGFTVGLADTLIQDGVIVNAIAPGPTATSMLGKSEGDNIWEPYSPSSRYALPKEIASLAVYLVSGPGDMIVGDTVYMTGGSGVVTLHH